MYDVAGRLLTRLLDAMLPAGTHVVAWDRHAAGGAPVAAGVYFFELRAGAVRQSQRFVLLD